MPIRERPIASLGELIDAVTPDAPDPDSGRRRDVGVYHGSSSATYSLLTSLDRLGGTDPPHTKAHLEAHVLRNFARYSRPYLSARPTNDWEVLVVAQHYGVPTRLLDWSYSPLVAAHFATRSARPGQACAIWRLDWQAVHRAFDLPGLALLIEDLQGLPGSGGRFSPWRLFDGDTPTFACMIEPPSLDARIVAQTAAFTLCSDTSRSFEDFLAEQDLEHTLARFVIPGEAVQHVRDQLDLAGLDERRLFPSLDGVAAAIRRYYA